MEMFVLRNESENEEHAKEVTELRQREFKELPGVVFAIYKDGKNWVATEQKYGLQVVTKDTLKAVKEAIVSNKDTIKRAYDRLEKHPPEGGVRHKLISSIKKEPAKLMKPLFHMGKYNEQGKRMRARPIKEVGKYRLWIDAGLPDKEHAAAENDRYYLYVEHDGWLAPLDITEFRMIDNVGDAALLEEWYDGDIRKRNAAIGTAREEGKLSEFLKKEDEFVQSAGNNAARQEQYIDDDIQSCIDRFNKSKTDDSCPPDFIGALFQGELDLCKQLRGAYYKKMEQVDKERRKRAEEEEEARRAEKRKKEERQEADAVHVFLNGGVTTDARTIVRLADNLGVNIPIRTRGWMLNSLAEVTVDENGGFAYRYWPASKRSQGSDTVYVVLNAVRNELLAKQKEVATK